MKLTVFVGIVAVLSMLSTASATPLIFNGDFSLGNTGFSTGYNSPLTGATSYDITNTSTTNVNFVSIGDHTQDAAALMMVVNGAESVATVWSQSNIAVLPNTKYVLSFWAANVCCKPEWISVTHDTSPAELAVRFNGIQIGSFISVTPGEWNQFLATWYSGQDTLLSLAIIDLNTRANGNDFALDDLGLQPSPVPIPSAAAQFLVGLSLISLLMWRRTRKARQRQGYATTRLCLRKGG